MALHPRRSHRHDHPGESDAPLCPLPVSRARPSMSTPLSPRPATTSGRVELPAYLSNGLIGLRVLDIPLLPGMVLVNGFSGTHPVVQVEAAAQAPYPLAGDIGPNGVW